MGDVGRVIPGSVCEARGDREEPVEAHAPAADLFIIVGLIGLFASTIIVSPGQTTLYHTTSWIPLFAPHSYCATAYHLTVSCLLLGPTSHSYRNILYHITTSSPQRIGH